MGSPPAAAAVPASPSRPSVLAPPHADGARTDASLARRVAARAARTVAIVVVGVVPFFLALTTLGQSDRLGVFGFDYRGTLWEPGRDVLHGLSPYPAATVDALLVGNPSVYPAPAIVLTTPLSLLPFGTASAVWLVLLAATVASSLLILGVRDWRCHGLVLFSVPVVFGLIFGNLTLLLMLGVALAWRYRDRPVVAGAAVAAVIALKIFLWPLAIWLLATRRFRAAAVAVGGAAATTLVAWAVLGFAGLREYPDLLQTLSDVYATRSWSLVAGVAALGGSHQLGEVVVYAAALLAVAATLLLARRQDGDRRAFAAAVVGAALVSPVVWPYNYALLIVPLAILRPRFSALWLFVPAWWIVALLPRELPGAPCCAPGGTPKVVWQDLHAPPATWQIAGYLAIIAVAAAALLRRQRADGERWRWRRA